MYGQLGMGDYLDRGSIPSQVPAQYVLTPEIAADIVCGEYFTCMRGISGKVYCFGRNERGQLGLGSPVQTSPRPSIAVQLAGPSSSICAGKDYACSIAVTSARPVQCWGANDLGQLMTGDSRDRGTNTSDFPLSAATVLANQVYCGYAHAAAITTPSTVKMWGDNRLGQLACGVIAPPYNIVGITPGSTPVTPVITGVVRSISLGVSHSCFLLEGSSSRCAGDNTYGQLGYPGVYNVGCSVQSLPPPPINLGFRPTQITCYAYHTCVSGYYLPLIRTSTPNVTACFGRNDVGQLGLGNTVQDIGLGNGTMPPYPVNTTTVPYLSYIGSSSTVDNTYIILSDSILRGGSSTSPPYFDTRNNLVGWGSNEKGQLLVGDELESTLTPVLLNTECGDGFTDKRSGEECDISGGGDGQSCTPFCNKVVCSTGECTPCHVSGLVFGALQGGCFNTSMMCSIPSSVEGAVCSQGVWSVVMLVVDREVSVLGNLDVTSTYTQYENGTLSISADTMISVRDTALIRGEIVVNGTVNSTVPILSAKNITLDLKHTRLIGGECLRYGVERKNDTGLYVLWVSRDCRDGMATWAIVVIVISGVLGLLLLGLVVFGIYKFRGNCLLFHDRKSYENIRDEWTHIHPKPRPGEQRRDSA